MADSDSSRLPSLEIPSSSFAMDDLRFVVKVSPAQLFFRGLMVMKSMTDSPSCFFLTENIKLRALVGDTFAFLIMKSWSWCSDPSFYTSDGIAVHCNSWEWMPRFPSSFLQQEDRPLYFCIKKGSKIVYWLAGVGDASNLESFEFCMGQVFRLRPENDGIDLDQRNISLYLRSECLREVLTTVASRYDSVMMVIFKKSVAWVSGLGELRHREESNQCRVEGVASGEAHYALVEWKGTDTLLKATEITDEVLIYAMTDPRCLDWISFKFIVSEDNHFRFAMRALKNQMVF